MEQKNEESKVVYHKRQFFEQVNAEYHRRQFENTYQSTISCCRWMEELGYLAPDARLRVLDIGSGQGGNIYYMSDKYPNCEFVGMDINSELIDKGNRFFKENKVENCRLETGDIYNMKPELISAFDAILCWQTLSWLPECDQALKNMARLKAKWICLMSLFDAHVSCEIKVKDYSTTLKGDWPFRESFSHVYHLGTVKEILGEEGYPEFQSVPFEIDIDLPQDKKGLGSYTRRLEDGRRLQMSGPLSMPWHFVIGAQS